jgi:hypothetical protein
MLKLVLDPVNKLTDEEMRKGGKAVITFDPDEKGTDEAPGAGRVDGTFKCFRAGTGINACITARGNLSKALKFAKDGDKAASAVLTADVTRKVIVKAGSSATLDLVVDAISGSGADAGKPNVTVEPSTVTKDWADSAHHEKGIKLTNSGDKDLEVTCSVEDLLVANGRFVDPNCNHKLNIAAVGPIHVDACAQLRRISGLKPNDHSFSIHVKDDPHAVVFSIDSDDKFDPKEKTASAPDDSDPEEP